MLIEYAITWSVYQQLILTVAGRWVRIQRRADFSYSPKKVPVIKLPIRFAGIAPNPAENPNAMSFELIEHPVFNTVATTPKMLKAKNREKELFFITKTPLSRQTS